MGERGLREDEKRRRKKWRDKSRHDRKLLIAPGHKIALKSYNHTCHTVWSIIHVWRFVWKIIWWNGISFFFSPLFARISGMTFDESDLLPQWCWILQSQGVSRLYRPPLHPPGACSHCSPSHGTRISQCCFPILRTSHYPARFYLKGHGSLPARQAYNRRFGNWFSDIWENNETAQTQQTTWKM